LPVLEVFMRRQLIVLPILALAALLVAACSTSNSPNWTYAPPTPAPTAGPSQSAGASAAAPSAAASAAPSAAASGAAPSAQASSGSGGGSGQVVDITAQNIDFTTKNVTAPANTPFTIHFDNQDASVPHNVVIKDASGMAMFTGDLVTGVAQKDYSVPALAAGTYTFVCQVHPNMTGTLTVGP
jgi:plastocyanin